jgi:hypothetical protein
LFKIHAIEAFVISAYFTNQGPHLHISTHHSAALRVYNTSDHIPVTAAIILIVIQNFKDISAFHANAIPRFLQIAGPIRLKQHWINVLWAEDHVVDAEFTRVLKEHRHNLS